MSRTDELVIWDETVVIDGDAIDMVDYKQAAKIIQELEAEVKQGKQIYIQAVEGRRIFRNMWRTSRAQMAEIQYQGIVGGEVMTSELEREKKAYYEAMAELDATSCDPAGDIDVYVNKLEAALNIQVKAHRVLQQKYIDTIRGTRTYPLQYQ